MSFHIYKVGTPQPLTREPLEDLKLACELAEDRFFKIWPCLNQYEVREVETGKVRFRISQWVQVGRLNIERWD